MNTPIIDFSQDGEQKVILDYFGPRTGVFISLGENDGQVFSNVRALALIGWSGVCVEPSPVAYAKLASLYGSGSPVVTVNAAITTADGPVDLYDSGTHLKKGDTALLSTTRPSEMDRWKKSGETFTKMTVNGITFKTLLERTGIQAADFISIDCEGVDYEILTQIDLTGLKCQMLCVEYNQGNGQRFIDYAKRHGMRLHHRNWANLIFVR